MGNEEEDPTFEELIEKLAGGDKEEKIRAGRTLISSLLQQMI